MYETERNELVEVLKKRGISNSRVLEAFKKVERDKFVPDIMKQHAYNDVALPIGYGQTISQPYTVAFMTEALDPKAQQKILEIGTVFKPQLFMKWAPVFILSNGILNFITRH